MKKIICAFLAFAMLFSFVACNSENTSTDTISVNVTNTNEENEDSLFADSEYRETEDDNENVTSDGFNNPIEDTSESAITTDTEDSFDTADIATDTKDSFDTTDIATDTEDSFDTTNIGTDTDFSDSTLDSNSDSTSNSTTESTAGSTTSNDTEKETKPVDVTPPVTYPEVEKPKENDPANVVFKQVYGTGYNTDTPFRHSFIELYNVSDEEIKLDQLAVSYMTASDSGYKKMQFPSGAVLAPHGSYLIRCGEAVDKNGNSYESKYEVSRIDYYDATWNVVIDNKSVKLAITDKYINLSATTDIANASYVYTYFIAAASTDYKDRNIVSGMSKQKAAYRMENTISSAFKIVDYSVMTPTQIADVRPQYSGGDRNTWLADFANKVEFSHSSGFYSTAFSLKLSAAKGYSIYYTTDGSDPRTNGKMYSTGGIALSLTSSVAPGYLTKQNSVLNSTAKPTKNLFGCHVIKAYATNGVSSSDVVTNSYFIIPNAEYFDVPFVSLSLTPGDFVSNSRGIYYTVMKNPFGTKERRVSYLELFESDGSLVSSSYVEIAMNGNGSLGMASKSLRVYFKADAEPTVVNNPSKLRYDIFGGRAQDGVTEYKRLLLRNSGNDSSMSHLRDGLMQALCTDMNVGTMAYRPSLLFVNGEFWGVYNLRERFDTKYFEEHYGVLEENLVILEAPSPLTTNWSVNEPYVLNEGVSGDEKVFHNLVSYITSKDMSDSSNYSYVSARLDVDSFIDFFVCNMYWGNTDWPSNNVKVWRNKSSADPSGLDTKWRYVVSDMDSGMGLGCEINTNMFTQALNDSTVAGAMMCALLENETFKNKFIERFTYACQTKFAYEDTIKVYNEYYNTLKSIIQLHFDRWPGDSGSISRWNSEMTEIKSFLKGRSEYALEHMNNYFGIQPAKLNVSVDLNKADLYINGTKITQSGYSEILGDSSASVTVKIVPKSGYTFNGIKTVSYSGVEKTYNTQTVTLKINECITVIGLISKQDLKVVPNVVAGSRSIFVLDKNGNLYSWGENDIAQCGVALGKTICKPMLVMSGVKQIEISRGGTEGDTPTTAILTDTGAVYTIGSNTVGQLGRKGDTTVLTKIDTNVKFTKIAVGFDHLLLLDENGNLYGCGNNAYGQLGNNNYTGTVSQITKIASNVIDMAAGRRHTLYITSDNKLYALGDNRWKKICSSTKEVFTDPFLLVSDAAKVYAGQHSSLYISTNGTLYYFGWCDASTFTAGNSNGKMNKIATKVESASIMDEHFVYTTTNGNVYGYGKNNYGQISSDKATKTSPTLISGDCIAASAGTYYSAYITSSGDVMVRGSNKSGVIGNGKISADYTAPYKALTISVE